jgi:hypothetical protein
MAHVVVLPGLNQMIHLDYFWQTVLFAVSLHDGDTKLCDFVKWSQKIHQQIVFKKNAETIRYDFKPTS